MSEIEKRTMPKAYAWLWGIRDKHDLKLTVLVNVLTNPIVVFVCYFVRVRHLPVHYGWVIYPIGNLSPK